MPTSRPPARTSKRPSKTPTAPKRASKAPPPRKTMEVQMAWLDPEEEVDLGEVTISDAPPSSASGRKKPPRLPGARMTLPPMPVMPAVSDRPPPPKRRATMEVEMHWLEVVDEDAEKKKKKAKTGAAPVAKEEGPKRPKIVKRPIRREEE